MNADVVVIGGGIVGTAVTFEIARRGAGVVCLDASRLEGRSTPFGGGFVSIATKKPGPHADLARRSVALYRTLGDRLETGDDSLGRRREGLLVAAISPEEANGLLSDSQMEPSEWLDGHDALKAEPALTPETIAARLYTDTETVMPVAVTLAYRQAAERMGSRFLNVRCSEARREGGGWTLSAIDDAGSEVVLSSPVVVVAAGAWSGIVGRQFGIEIPVVPRRGVSIWIDAASRILKRPVLSASYVVSKFASDSTVSSTLWHRPDGVLFVGGTREWAGFSPVADRSVLHRVRESAERLVPAVSSLHAGAASIGFRPASLTGLPLIGPSSDAPNVFVAAGHEGDGVCLAPVTAEAVAELVAGEPPDPALAAFALPASGTLRGQGH